MPRFVMVYLGGNQPSSPEKGKQHFAKYMEWLTSPDFLNTLQAHVRPYYERLATAERTDAGNRWLEELAARPQQSVGGPSRC